jgi:hypothetical protein
MAEDHGWMYGGWKKGGAHTMEWMSKTQEFIDCAFSLPNNHGAKCSCSRCRNGVCGNKRMLTLYLCKVDFMLGYEVWMHHNESVHQTTSVVKEKDDRRGDNRMDEMLDVIQPELETNLEDSPTLEMQFFLTSLELQKSRCMNTR